LLIAESPMGTRRKTISTTALLIPMLLLFGQPAQAAQETNFPAPVTARDFYNAGTKLLAAKNFADAERMFQSALAAQDERIQPMALFNLGHTRFGAGSELLKKGPDAQKVSAQGNAALAAGENALRSGELAVAENDLSKMIAAYLAGRGARHGLRDAEKAVQSAMETYGKTLLKWQRAADDFKGAAELNPADTNATHNAEIVERGIAKLVDELNKMQQMMGAGRGMMPMQMPMGQMPMQFYPGAVPAPMMRMPSTQNVQQVRSTTTSSTPDAFAGLFAAAANTSTTSGSSSSSSSSTRPRQESSDFAAFDVLARRGPPSKK